MHKHAYLITAHHQFTLLCRLIKMIDDERNDIYIHIDKKAKNVPFNQIKASAKKSSLFFTTRIRVKWGGYSQIKSELVLLKTATDNHNYTYYHLISGSDLPIQNQDMIHNFFQINNGKEFVQFQNPRITDLKKRRVKYFYPMQEILRSQVGLLAHIQEGLVRLQAFLGINRLRKLSEIQFQMGSNWFSITDSFARYVLTKQKFIRNTFKNTKCCDELFLQTLLVNSPFEKNLFDNTFSDSITANERFIVWVNGAPRDLKIDDLSSLKASECLFARKFNTDSDEQIINDIVNYYG